MEIVLQIPAQPATEGVPRQMVLVEIDFQNGVIVEARDAKHPARIRFVKGDIFPWDQFLQKLAVYWQLSRNDAIPRKFRLKKKLPQELNDWIPKLTSKESLTVLKQLNDAGFITAFNKPL